MNQYLQAKQNEFAGALDFFKKDISSLRTGRANPALLENVQVEAYGTMNPLNAVGNIAVSDTHSIVIAPWDKGVLKNIEKAIVDAGLGFGVVNEGDKVRLTVPPLTEENRKELVKKLNEKLEKTRVNLRQARDHAKSAIETAFDDKEISEDDKFRFIKELDEFSAKKNEELKEVRDRKEKDIMEI
ncbi:TPA: ribosome recycling factor [Candidatus Falkowbacteria bacterium]|jgi:ribosome recycling factor|nr:MAG: Ribosome-recycling factor [Candidatus Falkowbacteria bacterium GW2011_GWF2_43_32]HBA36732.1 ribosome recycling factor [Candidatus Falkowbacteria bacterium]